MDYKIEKGIPLPATKTSKKGESILRLMEVGDSLFTDKKQSIAAAWASGVGKAYNLKFATRRVEGGTRIWRIA